MRFLNRFPVRLSVIFLVLITLMGAASVFIGLRIFERRQAEIDQRLNRDVAANMAQEIAPFISDAGPGNAVAEVMHYMMVLNPAVEIYLLGPDGTILDYFTSPGPDVELSRVTLDPVRAFLEGDPLPIYGDNPRRPGESHHFSASTIDLGDGSQGYLYVILRSSGYDVAEMDLEQRYLFRALQTSVLITIPLVGILGLLAFFLATRPLERLSRTVRRFGAGDHGARAGTTGTGEIADLAASFNAMAQTIVENLRRIREADSQRRELTANISHDIRNPLATIQGYLETLVEKDSELDGGERRRYYQILLDTASSLPRLVDDLFELSRLDDPGTNPLMEPLSLAELVGDVVMQWKSRGNDRGVTISLDEPAGLHMVRGNAGLLERALTNLIRNALVHTPKGGWVRLGVEETSNTVRVTVADSGSGIATEDLPRIFNRFYIGDTSRSRSKDGSGLGLAICRRIVELHNGDIRVESKTGVGSTFSFEIPALQRGAQE